MPDSIAPESRIFRIGRECYVVYLGKERDDIRPFLRIGNARDIPEEVHKAVGTTVVTDDHVGNPLLEILHAPRFSGRYLGDTGVVDAIRLFFESFDLPTDELTDYRQVKDGERRHMVWFYTSGNIQLRYEDQVIFNLDEREKKDRHFVRLYEEAKEAFSRNPLRYTQQDFSGRGLVLSEGNAFWFDQRHLLSLEAHPGFVPSLMGMGVDPDLITASAYDLDYDAMDSRDAAVFIGYVKRVRQRRQQLDVFTTQSTIFEKLSLLFPARDGIPAAIAVKDISKKSKDFASSRLSHDGTSWKIHPPQGPAITFGNSQKGGLRVLPHTREIMNVKGDEILWNVSIPEGFPIEIHDEGTLSASSVERYFRTPFMAFKDLLLPGEATVFSSLDRIFLGESQGKPEGAHGVQSSLHAMEICEALSSLGWFLASNAIVLLQVQTHSDGIESYEPLAENLRSLLHSSDHPHHCLPFWGDLYLGSSPQLLWRTAKRSFSQADLRKAMNISGHIDEIAAFDAEPWKKDQERLLALIRSLGKGGTGALTPEQRRLLGEKPRPQSKPKTSEESPPQKTKAVSKPVQISPPRAKPRQGSSHRPIPILGISLAILALLLAGLLSWDLSGRAPWGRLLSSSQSGVEAPTSTFNEDEFMAQDLDAQVKENIESDEIPVIEALDEDSSQNSQKTTDDLNATTPELVEGEDHSQNILQQEERVDFDESLTEESEISSEEPLETVEQLPSSSQSQIIDPDRAPRNQEEVKAYLNMDDRLSISEADIHLAANEIAVLNGYKDLNYKVFTGSDPNWIFPGTELLMPEGGPYVIQQGDTIWFLAARTVRLSVTEDFNVYDRALEVLKRLDAEDGQRVNALQNLKSIGENSKSRAMRQMAKDALVMYK
ncbi:MAG: hypothetical protein MI717_03170 [Spirochaetales bacterium]|nr:hypothetical protein [Spirochaetales bacterium]